MDPVTLGIGLRLKNFFSGLIKSRWFYVGLAVLAIGAGTYFYLRHSTAVQVNQAVAAADSNATIQTYQTREQAEAALAPRIEQAEQKAEQTRRDYSNVRQQVARAPQPQREASAPPLIVDTLNRLERLSRQREQQGGVPDAEVHASGTDLPANAAGSASR